MAEPKDIGPLFVYGVTYQDKKMAPMIDSSWTREVEEPFRYGTNIIVRLPFSRRALVVGRWQGAHTEEESALNSALLARPIDVTGEEVRAWSSGE